MRIIVGREDRKYLYVAGAVLVIIVIYMFQQRAVRDLQSSIKEKAEKNVRDNNKIKSLEGSLKTLSAEVDVLMTKADSLQASEEKYKNSYYATDKNLRAILGIYAGSSDDDKWNAFTKSLHE